MSKVITTVCDKCKQPIGENDTSHHLTVDGRIGKDLCQLCFMHLCQFLGTDLDPFTKFKVNETPTSE